MSIHILLEKIKSFLGSEKGKDIFVGIVVVCVAISSFVLGRLSVAQKDLQNPVVVKFDPSVTEKKKKKGESGESSALLGDEETSPSLKEKSSLEENGGGDSTAEEKEVLGAKEEKGDIVASSRGSKYYYTHCSGAKSLSEANKVYFSSEEEAEANGYTLSSSCSK